MDDFIKYAIYFAGISFLLGLFPTTINTIINGSANNSTSDTIDNSVVIPHVEIPKDTSDYCDLITKRKFVSSVYEEPKRSEVLKDVDTKLSDGRFANLTIDDCG